MIRYAKFAVLSLLLLLIWGCTPIKSAGVETLPPEEERERKEKLSEGAVHLISLGDDLFVANTDNDNENLVLSVLPPEGTPAAPEGRAVECELADIDMDAIPVQAYAETWSVSEKQVSSVALPIGQARLLAEMSPDRFLLLDIRGESAYAKRHVAGAENIPSERLEQELSDNPLPRGIIAVVYGEHDAEVQKAVGLLTKLGYFCIDAGVPRDADYENE